MQFWSNVSQNAGDVLIVIIATLMAICVAMPFHEFAHAYAAKREGDYTAVCIYRTPVGHLCFRRYRFGQSQCTPLGQCGF